MKRSIITVAAILCLGGFTIPSFADEMGKMKNDMKTEGMSQKDAMKGKQDDMKGQKDSMKGETKPKHDEMKGEMKSKHDDMKGEMKGAMGK